MNIYKNNLEVLKKYSLALYNTITKEKPIFDVTISSDESKLKNYKVKIGSRDCYINSIYDKEREVIETLRNVPTDTENLIMFGFGSDLHMDHINQKFYKLKNIIVVEPSLQIFKKRLNYTDIYQLATKFNALTFVLNKNYEDAASIIIEILQRNLTDKVAIVYNVSYKSLFKEYFIEIESILSKFIRTYLTNTLTKENFKQLWIVNTFKNLKINEPFFLTKNKSLFNGKTAIMISGGPSLEKNIEDLKHVGDKAVIFAVGSAIKILDSNNIIPHFRVAVDGHDGQIKIFDKINDKSSPLIHATSSFYKIPELYNENLYKIVLKSDFLTKYIFDAGNVDYQEIDVGNSVANCTLDLICKLGFKRIIFLGQDLCYSSGKIYASGSWRNETINNFEEEKKQLIEKNNICGEKVYTNIPFLNMKDSLEVKIFENNQIEYINCTEHGLRINGTIEIPFYKLLNEIQQEDELNILDVLAKINRLYVHEEYIEAVSNGILKLEEDLNMLINLNDSVIKIIQNNENENDSIDISIKKIIVIENEINDNIFFKRVVLPYIGDLLKAVEDGMASKLKDIDLNKENKIKVFLNKSVELKQYFDMIELLIKEYKGILNININYN